MGVANLHLMSEEQLARCPDADRTPEEKPEEKLKSTEKKDKK